VTFTIEGHADLIVQIKGKAVSFVAVDPATLDPETNKEGKFKLRATDGQPFRIRSAMPVVLGEYSHEPAVEHELTVSWEKYRQVGPEPSDDGLSGSPQVPAGVRACQLQARRCAEGRDERAKKAQKTGSDPG
jgi:hypothetical protein